MPKSHYPTVTYRRAHAEDPVPSQGGFYASLDWHIVEQDGAILATCPSAMAAAVIAERLNEWFRREPQQQGGEE